MPAPSAAFILSMLNPYSGFDTARSAQAATSAAAGVNNARLGQQQLAQQKELAQADDARANQYLQLQRDQYKSGQENFAKEHQAKAFAEFQDAIANGDTERAKLAAAQLQQWGVDVQEYGPGDHAPAGQMQDPNAVAGAMPGESPSVAIDRARSAPEQTPESFDPNDAYGKRSPPSPSEAKLSGQLDEIARVATVAPAEGQTFPEPEGAYDPEADVLHDQQSYDPEGDAKREMGAVRPSPARDETLAGDEPAPAGEAQAGQPLTRGYRLNFNGKTIDIDPQMVLDRQRERVAGVLEPILANAQTPEEERAARKALSSAARAVGTVSPREAVGIGLKIYQTEMDRTGKEKRARIVSGRAEGFGGVPGLGKEENAVYGQLNDDIRQYVQGVETKFGVPKLREQEEQSEKVKDLLESKNPLAERGALAATLKSWFSSVTSDRELSYVLAGNGKLAQLEMEYNQWVNEGHLPSGFVQHLKEALLLQRKHIRAKKAEIGEQAAQGFVGDFTFTGRMTPEQAQATADNIRSRFTGVYVVKPGTTARQQPGKKAEAPAAKGGTAQSRAEALKKKLRGE